MAQSFTGKKRIRKSFGRIPEAVQMPNLIEVQRSSYEQFLQRETRSHERRPSSFRPEALVICPPTSTKGPPEPSQLRRFRRPAYGEANFGPAVRSEGGRNGQRLTDARNPARSQGSHDGAIGHR